MAKPKRDARGGARGTRPQGAMPSHQQARPGGTSPYQTHQGNRTRDANDANDLQSARPAPPRAAPPGARPANEALHQRVQARRAATSRRYPRRDSKARSLTPVIGAVAVVALLVGVFVWIAHRPASATPTAQAAPTSVVAAVTQVKTAEYDSIGSGGVSGPFIALPTSVSALTASGKPEWLYMGAEYCPYCAAERWSMVAALSRFGTFTNLGLTESSSTDVYPNTNTFTFYGSSYTSKYISFTPVELTTRNAQQMLQTPTAQQQQILNTYDNTPYIPSSDLVNGQGGAIPFQDLAGQYLTIGPGYSPQLLTGLTWQQIASRLSNPNDPVTQGILGNANYLTAGICQIIHNSDTSVCSDTMIQHLEHGLPPRK